MVPTAPFSARNYAGTSSPLITLNGRTAKGYVGIPPVERSAVMQLCPPTATSWIGNQRAGDSGVCAVDVGVLSRHVGVRAGDVGVRSGDCGVRAGDAGVRSSYNLLHSKM